MHKSLFISISCKILDKTKKPTLWLELQDKNSNMPFCFLPEVLLRQENKTPQQYDSSVHYPCRGSDHGSSMLQPANIIKKCDQNWIIHIIEYRRSLSFRENYLINVDSITNLGFKEFPFDEPEMLLSMSLVEVTSWKAVISLLIKVRNTSIRFVSCFWRLCVG